MQKPRHHGGASSYSTKLNATQQLLVLLAALLTALLAALLAWLILLLLAALLAAATLLLAALLSTLLLLARFVLLVVLVLIHFVLSRSEAPERRSFINAPGLALFLATRSRRNPARHRGLVGRNETRMNDGTLFVALVAGCADSAADLDLAAWRTALSALRLGTRLFST